MHFVKDKNFYITCFKIGIPIILQGLISQATTTVDSLMLGNVDGTGVFLSAASLANQPFRLMGMFCFGLAGGASVLCSQYWGKKDLRPIRTIMSMVLKISLIVSFLFSVVTLAMPEKIMSLYTPTDRIIVAGASYLRIVAFDYIFFAFSSTLICMARSVEIVNISLICTLSALVTNLSLNWILIFGHLGFAPMGIRGAAIATLISRLLEFLLSTLYIFCFDHKLSLRFYHLKSISKPLLSDLLKYGTPVLANEVMFSLATNIQASIIGHITYISGDPVAAYTVSTILEELATASVYGVSTAACVLVGMSIGNKQFKEARERTNTLLILSVAVGAATAGIILALKPFVLRLYQLPVETLWLADQMITVTAFIVFFLAISYTCILGVLRGAGDTRFCLITEISLLWIVALPCALLATRLQFPIPVVLICMRLDDPLKTIFCFLRIRGNRWMKPVTR
ncbi:MAG: MATE family efflux transporter [Lachnospiraceae bacterium]|nr:MATE family efflux transporter [Lachnospiraceae bacterium]